MPEIRFKDFKNEWKHFSFKEITYKAGIKNSENLSLESYSISNELGFIPQKEQFENGGTMSKADKRMYYIVSSNSFAYNPARINVGSLGYYQGIKDVIVSSLYEVFKTSDIVDDLFLLYWFKTNIFKRMIEQYQEGSVRLYFFFDKLQKCQIKIPSLQEQQKIAFYFQKLDSLIQVTTKKLASLKQIKAASLQSMFPQEGETVPKVRFKGFEGEWEEKSFSALYKKSIIKNDLTFGTDKIISVANMYYLTNVNVSDLEYLKTYNIMKLGDIAFEGNKSKRFLHGRFVENTIGDGIVSHVFVVFHPISAEHDINYWKYAINNENIMSNVLIRCTKSSTMMTDLVVDDFLKETILVPSYAEQQKIGVYFRNLDQQISLQTQRLEKLKQIKAACLDKMFV